MIGYRELKAIRGAMQQVADGSYQRQVAQPVWVAEGVTDEQMDAYKQAIKETYESGYSEFEFAGKKYAVSFVKEDKTVSIKPTVSGKVDVLVGGKSVRSFNEARQARVYAAQLTEMKKSEPKASFNTSLITSVTEIS